MKVNGFLAIISALVVALALLLLLTPVSSQFSDPCGSVLVPTKVHYSDGGHQGVGLVDPQAPTGLEVVGA